MFDSTVSYLTLLLNRARMPSPLGHATLTERWALPTALVDFSKFSRGDLLK